MCSIFKVFVQATGAGWNEAREGSSVGCHQGFADCNGRAEQIHRTWPYFQAMSRRALAFEPVGLALYAVVNECHNRPFFFALPNSGARFLQGELSANPPS